MAKAIQSVEGATLVVVPKQAVNKEGTTVAVVELSGSAKLGAVTTAVENAKTPHSGKNPPAVATVIPGKVKPDATPESITNALKKADLMAQ